METIQFIRKANRLTGFYMVRVFAGGYFQTDYNTVLFSEAAMGKCPSILISLAGSFLVGFQTVSR